MMDREGRNVDALDQRVVINHLWNPGPHHDANVGSQYLPGHGALLFKVYFFTRRLCPVISFGWATPSMSSRVGEMSARMPFFTLHSAWSAET